MWSWRETPSCGPESRRDVVGEYFEDVYLLWSLTTWLVGQINVSLPCRPTGSSSVAGFISGAQTLQGHNETAASRETLTGRRRSLGQNEKFKVEWILWETTETSPEPNRERWQEVRRHSSDELLRDFLFEIKKREVVWSVSEDSEWWRSLNGRKRKNPFKQLSALQQKLSRSFKHAAETNTESNV